MDRELRDWLKGLADTPSTKGVMAAPAGLSGPAADYLARVATDGTLKAALAELAAGEPELAG